MTVTYFGLGGAANLVANGENILHLRYRTDNGFTLNLNLGGVALPISLTAGAPNTFQDLYISLIPWMSAGNGNLTNVTSASFTFSGLGISSADGAIDVIETVVPEPMSFVMMGAGLLAIGALRLRKRA